MSILPNTTEHCPTEWKTKEKERILLFWQTTKRQNNLFLDGISGISLEKLVALLSLSQKVVGTRPVSGLCISQSQSAGSGLHCQVVLSFASDIKSYLLVQVGIKVPIALLKSGVFLPVSWPINTSVKWSFTSWDGKLVFALPLKYSHRVH